MVLFDTIIQPRLDSVYNGMKYRGNYLSESWTTSPILLKRLTDEVGQNNIFLVTSNIAENREA